MRSDPILAAFARRRSREPHAILTLGDQHHTSVSDVDHLRQSVADLASSHGLRAGALVALAAVNGAGFLGCFLGLRQAGCPIVLLDAQTPAAEQQRIATALGCQAILHCKRPWPRQARDLFFEPMTATSGARSNGTRSGGDAAPELAPEIAVVKLTSGSTGLPRGILTTSDALIADDAALTISMGLGADERISSSVPMSHSYGLSSIVMPALMRSAVLITSEPDHPVAPLRLASEHRATFLPTVPAVLQALLQRRSPPPLPPSLRLVISAGAPLQPDTARRFREVHGQPVHVFYGASEAGGITFDQQGQAAERGTLGTPVYGVDIRLEPADRGAVSVTSPAVARGYLEPSDLEHCNGNGAAAQTSSEAGATLEDGTFRTRDLAYWQDGELKLEGRLDDLINVKGKKVNPREVEGVLGRMPGVVEAVVLGLPRPSRGDHLVGAFLVGQGDALEYSDVQAWCRQHLAEHKVPRSIVRLDSIPRTSRGKLDRRRLLALRPTARPS